VSLIKKVSLFGFSILSIAYGIRYTYGLSQFANVVTAWLALSHLLERRRTKGAFSAVPAEEGEGDGEPLQMQEDIHSTVPDSIKGIDILPESISASLRKEDREGYALIEEEDRQASRIIGGQNGSRDALLERYLDLLDEYFESKKQISDDLMKGHFQLSKARMQLGRLTSLNDGWDARMKSSWAVKMQNNGQIELEQVQPSNDVDKDAEGVLIEEKGESSLRRRKAAQIEIHAGEIMKESDKEEKEKVETKKKGQAYDPLYQFTALPPPSLRQAQSSFSTALTHLIDGRGPKSLLQIQSEMKDLEEMIEQSA
jgi:hypothetical protein